MDFLGLGSGHFVALRFAHLQHAFFVRRFGIFARCIRCSMSHPFLRRARKSLECVFFLTLPGCAFSSLARSFISFFLLWTCCGFGHDLLGFSYVTARPLELVLRAAIYPFVVLLAHALRASSCLVVMASFILTRCPISLRSVPSWRSIGLRHSTTWALLSRAARPPSPSKTKG